MADLLQSAGTDQEMLSQTETEDTDSGEVSSDGVTSSDTSGSSITSTDSAKESVDKARVRKLTNISVDLTDVTALEDNASQGEDSLCEETIDGSEKCINSAKNKETGNSTRKGGLYDVEFNKDWYNHDCFKSYWQHYNQVMSWCSKHTKVCDKLRKKSAGRGRNSCTSTSPGLPHLNPYSQYFHPSSFSNLPTGNHPYFHHQYNMDKNTCVRKNSKGHDSGSNCSRRKKNGRRRKPKSSSSSEVTSGGTQTETSEEFQMEISQDMIDFFAKTQAHRKERDEARKADKEEEAAEPEHINVEDVKVTETRTPTIEAPKERPGAKRTAEMKMLYGKGAAMIHGMETALQMTYDRNVDLKQPKTWPNMPLRIIFT